MKPASADCVDVRPPRREDNPPLPPLNQMQTVGKLMKVFVTRRIPPEGMKILSAAGVYALIPIK